MLGWVGNGASSDWINWLRAWDNNWANVLSFNRSMRLMWNLYDFELSNTLTRSPFSYLERATKTLTLLLRHITGHNEQPNVQQQQTQPQNNHFTLTGRAFFKIPFIRPIVALNSSGATRETNPEGNSELKRLLRPNLQIEETFQLIKAALCNPN